VPYQEELRRVAAPHIAGRSGLSVHLHAADMEVGPLDTLTLLMLESTAEDRPWPRRTVWHATRCIHPSTSRRAYDAEAVHACDAALL